MGGWGVGGDLMTGLLDSVGKDGVGSVIDWTGEALLFPRGRVRQLEGEAVFSWANMDSCP